MTPTANNHPQLIANTTLIHLQGITRPLDQNTATRVSSIGKYTIAIPGVGESIVERTKTHLQDTFKGVELMSTHRTNAMKELTTQECIITNDGE